MKNYGKRLRRLVIIVSSSTKGAHLYEFVKLPLCPCCFKAILSLLERTNSEGRTKVHRRDKGTTELIPMICNVEITSVIFFQN